MTLRWRGPWGRPPPLRQSSLLFPSICSPLSSTIFSLPPSYSAFYFSHSSPSLPPSSAVTRSPSFVLIHNRALYLSFGDTHHLPEVSNPCVPPVNRLFFPSPDLSLHQMGHLLTITRFPSPSSPSLLTTLSLFSLRSKRS